MNIVKIYEKFPSDNDCVDHLEFVRWGNNPKCPYCTSCNLTSLPNEFRHHCNDCNTSFSVTVNTIFHRTHLPLQKWFLAIALILNNTKKISARQLASRIDVNKNTAWRMTLKIREGMQEHWQRELLMKIAEYFETKLNDLR